MLSEPKEPSERDDDTEEKKVKSFCTAEYCAITNKSPTLWDKFSFLNYSSVFWKCYKGTISLADLRPLYKPLSSTYTYEKLGKPPKDGDTPIDVVGDGVLVQLRSGEADSRGLTWKFMAAFPAPLVFSCFLELLFNLTRLLPVFTIESMIRYVKGTGQSLLEGYYMCLLMFLWTFLSATFSNNSMHECSYGAIQFRGAVLSAIFKKSLRTSHSARCEHTTGDLLNMINVDVDNIFSFIETSVLLLGLPLRIITAVILLASFINVAAWASFVVMLLLMPISFVVLYLCFKFQDMQMGIKDSRINFLNETLNGIKIIKLYAWEMAFVEVIEKFRRQEISLLKKVHFFSAVTILIWNWGPFLTTAAAFVVYILYGDSPLTATKAFITLFLLRSLRVTLVYLPYVFSKLLRAKVSAARIQAFLDAEELPDTLPANVSEGNSIEFHNACFSWASDEPPSLKNINLNIKKGELVAVLGKVGSGKSTLINAILNEVVCSSGSLNVSSTSLAYVPQQAWILNDTVRKNVIFTKAFEKDWYTKIIKQCCMVPDLHIFSAQDHTEIGERGVNLSGGQKQRISIARAVYQNSDIYLLDDPLSALDAHVSMAVFKQIISNNGLLKEKTRILTTHNIAVLPYVDRIVILDNGEIIRDCTYNELKDFNLTNFVTSGEELKTKDASSPKPTTSPSVKGRSQLSQADSGLKDMIKTNVGDLVGDEDMEIGAVKWTVYKEIISSFGVFFALSTTFGYIIVRVLEIYGPEWIKEWTEDTEKIISFRTNSSSYSKEDIDKLPDVWYRMWVYIGIGGVQGFVVVVALLCNALGCIRAASRLHSAMLTAIMNSPMTFFDSTPFGRIINRFGKDVDVLDVDLYSTIDDFVEFAFNLIGTVVLTTMLLPIFFVMIFPILIFQFGFLQKIYSRSGRQLKRLMSVTRSPVMNNFSEAMNGVASIRAYKAQKYFIERHNARADVNQNCIFHGVILNNAGVFIMNFIGSVLTTISCILMIHGADQLSSSDAGLILTFVITINRVLGRLLVLTSLLETTIVAAERLLEYAALPPEGVFEIKDCVTPEWPDKGHVIFNDYSAKYRPDLPTILRNLCLDIPAGNKVGIVGRTGAGKSSLTLALFRIIEASEGSIVIDDIDIAKIGLHDLRSRLTMIPQDPVIFKGSLRTNLDPHEEYSDEEVKASATQANLFKELEFDVQEGGSNLSVGERQLICLARALLRRSKVVVLDEATAAVDMQTDALMQKVIREVFRDSTILTIAHRLNTVADYDTIVVMSHGQILEVGSPHSLYQRKDSVFRSMAREAGLGENDFREKDTEVAKIISVPTATAAAASP